MKIFVAVICFAAVAFLLRFLGVLFAEGRSQHARRAAINKHGLIPGSVPT